MPKVFMYVFLLPQTARGCFRLCSAISTSVEWNNVMTSYGKLQRSFWAFTQGTGLHVPLTYQPLSLGLFQFPLTFSYIVTYQHFRSKSKSVIKSLVVNLKVIVLTLILKPGLKSQNKQKAIGMENKYKSCYFEMYNKVDKTCGQIWKYEREKAKMWLFRVRNT